MIFRSKQGKPSDLFLRSQAQFGNAVKSIWLYEPGPCPGCGLSIDAMYHKGSQPLSMNTFIYRNRGLLIGYFLCGRCGNKIHKGAEKNPGVETKLHKIIEENLKKAYERKLN